MMSTPDQPAATLPYSLLSTEQIRDLEAFALSQGLARGELMARAGEALYAPLAAYGRTRRAHGGSSAAAAITVAMVMCWRAWPAQPA